MAKKTAMVAPVPRSPSKKPVKPRSLEEMLFLLGNDRAYTVISSGDSKGSPYWVIHFEGDTEPITITLEGEKPEII